MAGFRNKFCRRGGVLPSATHLRRNFVPIIAAELRLKISSTVYEAKAQKSIFTINIDETTYDRATHSLNIVLRIRDKKLLADTFCLEKTVDRELLAKVTNEFIEKHCLSDEILIFSTDNAAYCKKILMIYLDFSSKIFVMLAAGHIL